MIDPDWEVPETFEVLVLGGMQFFIDVGTRDQIEAFLEAQPTPYDAMTINDLAGSEVRVLADAVNYIFTSSPESRARDRRVREMLEQEESGI